MALFDLFKLRAAATDKPPSLAERRRRPRKKATPGTTILIIDDSKTMVAALGQMLRENNFVTFEAFDGESAIELLRQHTPNLIFLEVNLPGISGFDVLRRIRRSQHAGSTPVVMMSGRDATTNASYVRRIGADDFMKKPCTRADIFSRLERWLHSKHVPRKAGDVGNDVIG